MRISDWSSDVCSSDLPAFMTRGEVKAKVLAFEAQRKTWPRDPDGAPLYPDDDRLRSEAERRALLDSGARHALRLDMEQALALVGRPLTRQEGGNGKRGTIIADPAAWGDVVLSR